MGYWLEGGRVWGTPYHVAVDELQELLFEVHNSYYHSYATDSRSADGMLQADDGRYPLFDGCWRSTLDESLRSIDLEKEAAQLGIKYWMCEHCQRPSSDDYKHHMRTKHPEESLGVCKPLTMDQVLRHEFMVWGGI